jgi:hypothetical protein
MRREGELGLKLPLKSDAIFFSVALPADIEILLGTAPVFRTADINNRCFHEAFPIFSFVPDRYEIPAGRFEYRLPRPSVLFKADRENIDSTESRIILHDLPLPQRGASME